MKKLIFILFAFAFIACISSPPVHSETSVIKSEYCIQKANVIVNDVLVVNTNEISFITNCSDKQHFISLEKIEKKSFGYKDTKQLCADNRVIHKRLCSYSYSLSNAILSYQYNKIKPFFVYKQKGKIKPYLYSKKFLLNQNWYNS